MVFDKNKTITWMKRHARPLEWARFEYLYLGGGREPVLDKLAAYQNKDGGFGHGLEPDFTLPASSSIATWFGCQILNELEVDAKHPMVTSVINYLVNYFNSDAGLWQTVTPEMNDYPHAPHWHFYEGVQQNWMYNPSVELAGFLVCYAHPESEAYSLGNRVIDQAIQYLLSVDEMNFHQINNFQEMLTLVQGKRTLPDAIEEKIALLINEEVNQDPSSWGKTYQALPLNLIKTSQSPLYESYQALVEENLNYLLSSVSDEGTWELTWSWEKDLDIFHVQAHKWKGIIILNNFALLERFNRL